MPVGATIAAVGGVASAGIQAYSAGRASDQQAAAAERQAEAANQALAFQKEIYNKNQGNLQPWIGNGTNAMYSLAGLYGLPTPNNPSGGAQATNAAFEAFTNLPAYKFPFEQGNLALTRQLNAQGRTQSGAQVRASQQFGQGLASQYMMSNYVQPLMTMAGQGQQAASSLASANANSGSLVNQGYGNLAQAYGNQGQAQAAGSMGVGNALSGGANSLAMYTSLAQNGGGSSYGGGMSFNSPGSSVGGAVGLSSYGGLQGPMPLNLGG